jgi:hypothetical protein
MDILQQNWALISGHPWPFASIALLFFGLGWGAARLLYAERLELLKERSGGIKQASSPHQENQKEFSYPTNGRHGRNLLSSSTQEVRADESFSLRAEIPNSSRLHLVLKGLPPIYLEDTSASWSYSVVGVANWVSGEYHQDMKSAEQHFDAESGAADLKLHLHRAGNLTIEAYEGTDQRPTWSKIVQVRPAVQATSASA